MDEVRCMAPKIGAEIPESSIAKVGGPANPSRRSTLRLMNGGMLALGMAGFSRFGAHAQAPAQKPDLDAARKEGALIVVSGNQQSDVVQLLKTFTDRFGIQAKEQHLLPGAAMPKFEAEIRAKRIDTDVYMGSDPGLFSQMQKKGQLLRYESPEIAAYAPMYRSETPGYFTAYDIIPGPMMYDPRRVDPAVAPKTWMDLLDPRWKGQIGFQNSAAGTQYAWWYLLKDVLPPDYWDKLAAQKPRAYASSTQIMVDIESGNLLIGGKVSILQFVRAQRKNPVLKMVFPPEGTPSPSEFVGILATTRRPNASKIFVDYLLSKEGQQTWGDIQSALSARPGIRVAGLPDLSQVKFLAPADMVDYQSEANHAKFVALWNRVTGF